MITYVSNINSIHQLKKNKRHNNFFFLHLHVILDIIFKKENISTFSLTL